MIQFIKPINQLHQRMLEDMTPRKLSQKTEKAYIKAAVRFTRFFGLSTDSADAEYLRRYQLHSVEQRISSTTLSATITGLKFFSGVTLDRPNAMTWMYHVYQPRKVPELLPSL